MNAMDGPAGGGRRPTVYCNKKQNCKNPVCSFHHFSPAANFELQTDEPLKSKICKFGAGCTKPSCPFNHPSPCTWGEGGDAPSRTSSADTMVENGAVARPHRPNLNSRGQGRAMDMVEADNDSLHSSGVPALSLLDTQRLLAEREAVLQQNQMLQQQAAFAQQQLHVQQQQNLLLQQQQSQMQQQPQIVYHHQITGDDVMGEDNGAPSRGFARGSTGSRANESFQDASGDVEMLSDETMPNRTRTKRGDARPDLRSVIGGGDLRDAINVPRNRVPNLSRPDLRSSIGNDFREDTRNSSNRDDMDDVDEDIPSKINSGKSSGLHRNSAETQEVQNSRRTLAGSVFSKPSPTFVSPAPNSSLLVSPDRAPANSIFSKPAKAAVTLSPASSVGALEPTALPLKIRDKAGMPPPIPKPGIFARNYLPPAAPQPDRGLHHGGSMTPKVQPSSPILKPASADHVTDMSVPKTVPGFKFGEEFLQYRSQILESSLFKERFRKVENGRLVVGMHDDMCHRNEWEEREMRGNHNKFQPSFETAYSDSELRRETELTKLYRSIKGIQKTLDHIQKNFKGDENAAREQFASSFYPTLRAAENDLKNEANKVYSKEWIVAVECMIKFCMHMYYLNTVQCDNKSSDMVLKSLEYAQKFILLLMEAYQEMWAQHVMPPNCEEFCALSLATFALARTATSNNKGGGLSALCRVYFMLPSHVRQRPSVQRTLHVLLCYFGDNITRFFELLVNDSLCPYLVVLMCSSEFCQIRCRFMKNLFAVKLEKVPFDVLARYLFHGVQKASQQLVLLLSSLKCTQNTDDGEVHDLGSIFEIESGSKPPSTISFENLPAAAVEVTTKKSEGRVTARDLILTFQRAMGSEFEALEQTPSRPQVDKHPGKFASFREALRSANKSEFQTFTPQLQQFVFSNWPMLAGAEDSVISFAYKNSTQPRPVTAISDASSTVIKPRHSDSVGGIPSTGRTNNREPLHIFSVSPTASIGLKPAKPPSNKIFNIKPTVQSPIPVTPSLGPETPPLETPTLPPSTPPFLALSQMPSAPLVVSEFDTSKSTFVTRTFSTFHQPVDKFHEMEDCTQPNPVVHESFLIPAMKRSDHFEGYVPALTVSFNHQSATQLEFFPKPVAREVIVSACKLEIDLNGMLDECEQDHEYVSFNSKLTHNESSWELNVTLNAQCELGDWMTTDAAIALWNSDLRRAAYAFSRSSNYGSAVLAMFGLGLGKRSVHFDWMGTSLAVVGPNLTDLSSCPSLPQRHELSADLLAVVFSWMVQDPYDFQDSSLQHHGSSLDAGVRQSLCQKSDAFKTLQTWAANKFSAMSSRFELGPGGTKTLVSCFQAFSFNNPATIAIVLISPHKNWPHSADNHTINDWMTKTCVRVKSIVSKQIAANIKGTVIIYFPSLVESNKKKVWKPSAPEMQRRYDEFCGGSSDVPFICMSPWEVLEIYEFARTNVSESLVPRDVVTEIWAHCLSALNPIRGMQESIHDQHDEAKFFSYGWPDITRSHVPRVQTVARCASSIVRSVLVGCLNLNTIQQNGPILDCCLFDSVRVVLFDEIATFCRQIFESSVCSCMAPVKDVVLLMLEVSLEMFEEILKGLKDHELPIQQTRKLIYDADASVDVDAVLSSSEDISHAKNVLNLLIQAFGDGVKQLKNFRKSETLEQCEAVAKCTISVINNLLKNDDADAFLPKSPNRRWRDDELWKNAPAPPFTLSNRFQMSSHCQALSNFIISASFCGTDKNAEFPNGRLLDSSYHRCIALQCIETLSWFVCAAVLHRGPYVEHEKELVPRSLKLLRRCNSDANSVQSVTAEALRKFQTGITLLKKVQPQASQPPPTQIKTPIAGSAKAPVMSPHRRRSLTGIAVGRGGEESSDISSILPDQHDVAPGLRVLHDIQVSEREAQSASDVLSEDGRINREFEQQMETFLSGTLAFLENSCVKRLRRDTQENGSTLEKDRRINNDFEEKLRCALHALE